MKRNIKAKIKADGYKVELTGKVQTSDRSLTKGEMGIVVRNLKQRIAEALSGLPYSNLMPFEVKVS